MDRRPDLLPCPFCGGSAECRPDEYGSGGQHVSPYHAGCRACRMYFTEEEPEDAIAAWNRRTDAALIAENARLRGHFGAAVELLGECIGPLEVSAAVIESEDGGEAIETLIGQVREFCVDAAALTHDNPARSPE